MIHLLLFAISLSFGQPVFYQIKPEKNFDFIDDFEKSKDTFKSEEFDLEGHSTEGGQVTVYRNAEKSYRVVDIWIFGEMGKVHASYWTDSNSKFIIVRWTDFEYDKPMYEKDFKTKETTHYLSYVADKVRVYDTKRKELGNSLAIEKKKDYEEFFQEMTRGVKIVK